MNTNCMNLRLINLTSCDQTPSCSLLYYYSSGPIQRIQTRWLKKTFNKAEFLSFLFHHQTLVTIWKLTSPRTQFNEYNLYESTFNNLTPYCWPIRPIYLPTTCQKQSNVFKLDGSTLNKAEFLYPLYLLYHQTLIIICKPTTSRDQFNEPMYNITMSVKADVLFNIIFNYCI